MKIPGRGNPELQGVSPILALAQRVASSRARFVMLLEFHGMIYPLEMLADRIAANCLLESGFTDFCSEHSQEHNNIHAELFRTGKFQLPPPQAADVLHEQILSGSINTGIRLHNVGDARTTALEILNAARDKLDRPELFVEKLMVNPMKARLPLNKRLKLGNENLTLFFFAQMAVQCCSYDKIELVSALLSNLDLIDRNVDKVIAQFGGAEKLTTDVYNEVDYIHDLTLHFRRHGDCDKYSAYKILCDAKGRAIINFGAQHGLIAPNAQSLPDQLVSQAKEWGKDWQVDILALVDSKHAEKFRESTLRHLAKGELRDAVCVYDVEKKQEWPILEWLAKYQQIYNIEIGVTSRTQPEP